MNRVQAELDALEWIASTEFEKAITDGFERATSRAVEGLHAAGHSAYVHVRGMTEELRPEDSDLDQG